MSYPYYFYFLDEDKLEKVYDNIRNYQSQWLEKKYKIRYLPRTSWMMLLYYPIMKPLILVHDDNYYEKYTTLANFYTEKERIKTKYPGQLSALEWWKQNSQPFDKNNPQEVKELNDYIFANGPTQAANFKTFVLSTFIDMFRTTRILDPCAGWGDRLITALAKNVDRYVGIDPNSALHPLYRRIVKDWNENTEVTLIDAPFEDAELPKEKFDLVFTSPPYFTLELYKKDQKQSSHFSNLETWFNKFLMVLLYKSWDHLIDGGYMIINITDYGKVNYTTRMIHTFNANTINACYLGCIPSDNKKMANPNPCWIWRKNNKIQPIAKPIGKYKIKDNYLDFGVLNKNSLINTIYAKNHGKLARFNCLNKKDFTLYAQEILSHGGVIDYQIN